MAGVVHGVGAGVVPRTLLPALGRPRAARHRRIDDRSAAGASQFLEAHPGTGLAVAFVAQLFTPG